MAQIKGKPDPEKAAADPQQKSIELTGNRGLPLVHIVCWSEEESCAVNIKSRVEVAGDPEAPLHVQATHDVTHSVEPLDHSLQVHSALAEPIHHAFQMRTPLQVRFCNPWHIASDYEVSFGVGKRELLSVRVRGATVATPQPCADDPCPPVTTRHVDHP